MASKTPEFHTFEEFYPFYLGEHAKFGTRVMHFIGTWMFLTWLTFAALTATPAYVFYGIVNAYGFAWISHFFIEQNKPATFKYPFFSLRGDFVMLFDLATGRQPWSDEEKKYTKSRYSS